MRKMSVQRRRLAVMASSLAAMSGVGPLLLRGNRRAEWVWLGVYASLLVWVIVKLVRLRRDEGCE